MDLNGPAPGIHSSIQHLPSVPASTDISVMHPQLPATAILEMVLGPASTYRMGQVGDRCLLLSSDRAAALLEKVAQIRTLLEQNILLIERKRKLEIGAFGIRHGRLTSRVLSVLSALAWCASLAANIWNEIDKSTQDKKISFISDLINIVALLLTSASLYGWYHYTSALKKAAKKNPESQQEIDRNKRILNVLDPALLFLQSCDRVGTETLLTHLNSVRIQHEFLSPEDKIRYPIGQVFESLIYVLPEGHRLRNEYDAINDHLAKCRISPREPMQATDVNSPGLRAATQPLSASGEGALERSGRRPSPRQQARRVSSVGRRRWLEREWGFPVPLPERF